MISAGAFLIFFSLAVIYSDKSVQFSYAGVTCVRQITVLPDLTRQSDESGFAVQPAKVVKVGDLAVMSLQTCFSAQTAPKPGQSKVSVTLFGGWFGKTTFVIGVPPPPVANMSVFSKPAPSTKPLAIELSGADTIFDYQLEVDDKTTTCPLREATIHCDIVPMELVQGEQYLAQLVRVFDDKKVGTIAKENITMLAATAAVKSSVAEGQTIYEKPKSFIVEFDKEVVRADVSLLKVEEGDKRTKVPSTTVLEGKRITLNISEDLARDSSFEFVIEKLEAKDASTLGVPYKTTFRVSGGPKLTAVSSAKTGAPLSQTVVLTFDQPLSDTQDITKFISAKGVVATISKKDNQAFVRYVNASKCTDFTISVTAGIQSKYEVGQNTPWSFGGRTICHSLSTIGYSKNGHPITAYIFGSGSQTILYTGAIHGSEISTQRLMYAWVDELEANARNIPANKTLVVVATINPDGVAAGTRNNANNVDLNRNFATSDWQKDITSPSNQPIENGGGTVPMSEPETQAIAAFTSQLRPRLTMSFHSIAGYAIANQAGDSNTLATLYAQMTGYQNMTGSSGAFDYSISGTYDDWIREKLGLPSVLVELASGTYSEFSRNRAALWAMARS